MKNKKFFASYIKAITTFILLIAFGCNEPITDFGYNAGISGTLTDVEGNIIAGDITSATLTVQALGENDDVTMVMRVKGDGTFANIKLYPQKYKVWVEGPVIFNDTVTLDLSGNNQVTQDFTATPFITIAPPELVGEPTENSIDISYEITETDGYTVKEKQAYCSNVPYPTKVTGSGPFYTTKRKTLSDLQGTATITGLEPATTYYIRIGVKADGQDYFNFSEQIVVNTL